MMGFLKRVLGAHVEPITHMSVSPAERDQEKEREIKDALGQLAHAVIDAERHSWQIRQELAGNVLRIVAGD